MRRAIVLLACAATVLAGAGEARATNECRGLMVCVPVAGPWVIVPATRHVQYQVACPRSYVIGGLDAELSHRAIDVTFPGRLGSPVNPGITTSTSAVFDGFYTGDARQVTSFRPHIGCIPASGGGGNPPTMISLRPAVFPPGRPLVRRVRTVDAVPGRTTRGAQGCGATNGSSAPRTRSASTRRPRRPRPSRRPSPSGARCAVAAFRWSSGPTSRFASRPSSRSTRFRWTGP